jgi:hypothetical protein
MPPRTGPGPGAFHLELDSAESRADAHRFYEREGPSDVAVSFAGFAREQVVPLDAIVGTLEPTPHFDARFRPASEVVRGRWQRIALAHRRGDALPPIDLVKRPDGYYVLDGRHRVSVARALGYPDIDARVTGGRASH